MTACLWDGAPRQPGSEFCNPRCETRYEEWRQAREETPLPEGVVEEPTERCPFQPVAA